MKKNILIGVISIILVLSLLFNVNAADACTNNNYLVSDGNKNNNLCFNSYGFAKSHMNSKTSNNTITPVMYKNGKIINAQHALVMFTSNGSQSKTINLYRNAEDQTKYTSMAPYYGSEGAFIDYDPSTNRVKIKISGFTGWTELANVIIRPINTIMSNNVVVIDSQGVNIRKSADKNSAAVGFGVTGSQFSYNSKTSNQGLTWYNINYNGTTAWIATDGTWLKEQNGATTKTFYEHWKPTGNLIHYYGYNDNNGSTYQNLGPAPSYLEKKATSADTSKNYYSFDGIYFYKNLISMLDDYKENKTTRAVNGSSPHYAYYLYLSNHTLTSYTANDFDQLVKNKGLTSFEQSRMYGQGDNFILSQEKYGTNALLTFGTAINESDFGRSPIAKDKNNLFGHGAYDSCPYTCATSYATVKDGIFSHAKMTGEGYNHPDSNFYYGSHYGNLNSGMNINYATDPYWGEKAASFAFHQDNNLGLQDHLSNTIGLKATLNNTAVKKSPSMSSTTIYQLKNKAKSVSNIPMVVFDKVVNNEGTWYKVYTDSALDSNQNLADIDYDFKKSYGYIKAEELIVYNNQPVINAVDKTVDYNSTVNLLDGIKVTDKEDGNIAYLDYTGYVDTTVPGNYIITYHSVDKSKFEVHKEITVTVKEPDKPVITANDIEIVRLKQFAPLDYVKAHDAAGNDISDKVRVQISNVNVNLIGEYELTYYILDTTVTKKIKVTVIENNKPSIELNETEIEQNKIFNPLEKVKAFDIEDGDITSKIEVIENTVDTSVIGNYHVKYKVKDKENQETIEQFNIKVVEKVLISKPNLFHINRFKFNETTNKIDFKGYLVIRETNNTNNQKFTLKLVEETTLREYTFDLNNWTTPPFNIPGEKGFNYNGSWFEGSLDFTKAKVPEGNYDVYITAKTNEHYTETILSNVEFSDNITDKAVDNNGRGYLFKHSIIDMAIPVKIYLRDEGLISTQQPTTSVPMSNEIFSYSFTGNELNIKGSSHIYGVNYASNINVERTLYIEDMKTKKIIKTFNIGSINGGPYVITHNVPDNLNKSRAWFDAKIDISDLNKGDYIFYIKTKANGIEDYGELTDYAYTDLTEQTTMNGKTYSLSRVLAHRLRLVLNVD